MAEFAGAFGDADTVQVLDIYAASEEPIPGIDAQALVKEIGLKIDRSGVAYSKSMAEAVARLATEAKSGDVIVTLGAGNVSQAGAMLLEALEQ
jgi:UDP-N-acetylmuramate--alanine ligase